MNPSSRLTLRFISYFTLFYLLIIIGFIVSLVFFVYIINDQLGDNIHVMTTNEIEENAVESDGNSERIADFLVKRADENLGQLYLFNKKMEILDYTGDNCELCNMKDSEILALERPGMHTWKLPKYYLFFLPNSPIQTLFEETSEVWEEEGNVPSALIQLLADKKAAIEIYDEHWKRVKVMGEQYKLLYKPDLLEEQYDIFEHKELIQSKTLNDNYTLVVRMPNPSYKSFEEPFNKAMISFLALFFGGHIILILGVVFLSLGISRQFVRPIVYIMSRIERFAQFDYRKVNTKTLHDQRTGKLKRKFKLFQPVDESLNHLSERLAFNERQIQKSEQLREEWITGLSHDLKTPLSSIYGYSTMLASVEYEWTFEEMRTFAKTMQEKATYMDALIQDLTFTYQLKNKAIKIEKKPINLNAWLQQFVDERLDVRVHGDVVLEADELLLKRILDNLITNAKKYTPIGTKVKVEAQKIECGIMLTITDKGTGIPQDKMDNLFERYYRGTNTTDDATGTGLGLAITKQLIDLHNGTIDVHSGAKGTLFFLIFHAK